MKQPFVKKTIAFFIAGILLVAFTVLTSGCGAGWHHRGGRGAGCCPKQNCPVKGGQALEVLKERYVRGEITKEQFEAMKKDITKSD